MNKVYMLNQKIDRAYNAAGKAMQDVFSVFGRLGMKIIPGFSKDAGKLFKALDIPFMACYVFFKAGKGDFVIYSYPENHIKIKLLAKLKKIKGFKLVCFVNDLNSIRYGSFEDESVKAGIREELSLVGCADIVMPPNNNSEKLLQEYGVTSRMIPVGAWDYLLSDNQTAPYVKHTDGKWKLAFAGNLDKSAFLFDLGKVKGDDLSFELWGNITKDTNELPGNCVYHGAVAPEELPRSLAGCHFGLVWDGISVNTCDGGLGVYLRYNNSHKCGLYLASGIPVFVWKQSGLAHFVAEHGCGYSIESLDEIDGILNGMSDSEYEKLIENTENTAHILRKGGLLENAYRKMF